jgi:hypothetical protein
MGPSVSKNPNISSSYYDPYDVQSVNGGLGGTRNTEYNRYAVDDAVDDAADMQRMLNNAAGPEDDLYTSNEHISGGDPPISTVSGQFIIKLLVVIIILLLLVIFLVIREDSKFSRNNFTFTLKK